MLKSFNKLKAKELSNMKLKLQDFIGNHAEVPFNTSFTSPIMDKLTSSTFIRPSSLQPKREYPYIEFSRVRTEIRGMDDYIDILDRNKEEFDAETQTFERNNKMINQLSTDIVF